MLHYRIVKGIIHLIIEDNIFEPYPTCRPPTLGEINHIQERERQKKVRAILKEYERRKCQKKTQD